MNFTIFSILVNQIMVAEEPSHKELTDVEKGSIIEEVRTRTAIWDSTHANHSKRNVINELFEQIAGHLSTTEHKITGNFTIFAVD